MSAVARSEPRHGKPCTIDLPLHSEAQGHGCPLDFATLREVRAMLGAARLDLLLDLLVAELDQRPRAIRAAIADRDFPSAAAQAHSLKAAAANLGAKPVGEAASSLEQAIAAANGDHRLVTAALGRVAATVGEAQQALVLCKRQAVLKTQ